MNPYTARALEEHQRSVTRVAYNIADNPEEFGLTVVGGLDEPNLSYEYNTLIVWKDGQGALYWAADSGCSCPIPFEDYNLTNIHPITPQTISEFLATIREFPDTAENRLQLERDVAKAATFRW